MSGLILCQLRCEGCPDMTCIPFSPTRRHLSKTPEMRYRDASAGELDTFLLTSSELLINCSILFWTRWLVTVLAGWQLKGGVALVIIQVSCGLRSQPLGMEGLPQEPSWGSLGESCLKDNVRKHLYVSVLAYWRQETIIGSIIIYISVILRSHFHPRVAPEVQSPAVLLLTNHK